jgi:hypothetical protein
MMQFLRHFLTALAILFGTANFSPIAAQQCRCHLCDHPLAQRGPIWTHYWDQIRSRRGGDYFPRNGPGERLLGSTQVVFLDFESGDNGQIDYTPSLRAQIIAELQIIYQDFDVQFTQTLPTGDFSTIVFNEGGFGGGTAEDIDFRNLNLNDNAVLNVDGLGLSAAQIVPLSILIAAHELGHLMGLRHADMFGPIGEGVLPGFGNFYTPDYGGPQNAFESSDHVMVTGAFGIPFSAFLDPSWFSERSSVKLTFSEAGFTTSDLEDNDSLANAQLLPLQHLSAPNTIVKGVNVGGAFSVNAAVVVGSLDGEQDPTDVFVFQAKAGDLLNLEVISNVTNRLAVDPINPNISLFDADGKFVEYYGNDAFNESELKTPDCILIDLIIPAGGTYFVQVGSSIPTDSGNYELLLYRFNGFLGDVNCDGEVTLKDVQPFVNAVIHCQDCPKADINLDGHVNLQDVQPFVALLYGN